MNTLRSYPLRYPTYTPDHNDRRELTRRNRAHRAFVDFIKTCRVQSEYPSALLTARRSAFVSQIRFGKVVVR